MLSIAESRYTWIESISRDGMAKSKCGLGIVGDVQCDIIIESTKKDIMSVESWVTMLSIVMFSKASCKSNTNICVYIIVYTYRKIHRNTYIAIETQNGHGVGRYLGITH